jgi:peptidoglycan/xylan/chitin deacetylase (PgdA/CDA1 family)
LILLYHRIASPSLDPLLLSVSPERFAEHLDVLGRLTHPVPLTGICESRHKTQPAPVAVTFDDGYADNLLSAMPLLETSGVPATFFVVSGQVGADREFFWDELERSLLAARELPSTLELAVDGQTLRFEHLENRTEETSWNVLLEETPSARHAAYRTLMAQLPSLDPTLRNGVIDELRQWAGIPVGARASHRPLTEIELRQLDSYELADVGGHTVGHPSLAALPPLRQQQEIEESKARLEELIGHRMTTFSYPFGGPGDYSRTTMDAAAGAGFDIACANVPGRVGPRTNRFQLPRVLVRDWDGDTFEEHLRRWLTG